MAKRRSKKRIRKKNNSVKILLISVIILVLLSFAITYFVMRMGSGTKENINKPIVIEPIINSKSPKHLLEGTWASYNDGAMLTIKDRSFSIDRPSVDGSIVATGTIVINNGKITFVYTNEKSLCGIKPGVYKFEFVGEDVKFSKIDDSCDSRSSQIVATWFKV